MGLRTIARNCRSTVQGSGILIAKDGQTYTVVTNKHVIDRGQPYRIQTPDGKIHQATLKQRDNSLARQDIAFLQFKTDQNYIVATLGDSKTLSNEQAVFAAGFPFESDRLAFNSGKISAIAVKPLVGGYQIGFSSETKQGMSGGALLDEQGKLIGILGQSATAILNDSYTYQDGSRPNEQTIQQMRQSSFAIPVAILASITPQETVVATNPKYTVIPATVDEIAQKVTLLITSRQKWQWFGRYRCSTRTNLLCINGCSRNRQPRPIRNRHSRWQEISIGCSSSKKV
ncbi:MAG: trypsin-like peptidase domain-containing protein [Hydrococcus sp. CSU_1_8]|nr:trypsin-like peptidase domain-containing protein [Hydrococcus sp. CSU_1_8]